MKIERSQSQLVCIQCGARRPLYETTEFRCSVSRCGGLYRVEHDLGFFSKHSIEWWRGHFDSMCIPAEDPRRMSGVWRFAPFIMPSLFSAEMMTLGEGRSPILPVGPHLTAWLGSQNISVHILWEGDGPTGAFKDFGMTVAVSVAKAMGIKAVACASTGDTSAAASAYAARAGLKCFVVLPKGKVTKVQFSQPLLHGARIIEVPGEFDDAMSIVETLALEGRVFLVNSFNPTRIEGHMASVFLATQFFSWEMPDVFVVPIGNGSNSSSIGKGIATLQQLGFATNEPKIIGGQSVAAGPLAESWASSHTAEGDPSGNWLEAYAPWPKNRLGETTASASKIGVPVSYQKVIAAIEKSRGAVFAAPEAELNEAMMLAGADGLPVCPQTGTALYALKEAIARGMIAKGQKVVVVGTAAASKFPDVPVMYGQHLISETPSCDIEEVAAIIGV